MKMRWNSWHARWMRFTYGMDYPENLCGYFWFLLMSPVLWVGRAAYTVFMVVAALVLFPIWLPLLGGFLVADRLSGKPPGVFRSWLKAKKEKVCPRIEWH